MQPASSFSDGQLPNIFIYTIPDNYDDEEEETEFDDIKKPEKKVDEVSEDEAITLDDAVIGATVLKGYAQFIEDSDAIYLKDDNNKFVLNIKTPQKISASKGLDFSESLTKKSDLNYRNAEYFIAPNSLSTSAKLGNFTVGALYNNEIDKYAMLETEAGLFTKYEKSRFALSTSVAKSLDTTTGRDYSNTFTISPELKVNRYLSLKSGFSANMTYNKYSSQVAISVNPFGKKDFDRLRFELGAKETYMKETETTTSQFLFSTKFKF